jgi:uncharacterized SAM-binding protein YcdF (DUF218 family)
MIVLDVQQMMPPAPGLMNNGSTSVGHAIVVFGAALNREGRPGDPLTRRLRRTLAEAVADPRALVIVSGGRVRGRPCEALAMRDWLVAEGLEAARIVIEAEAKSTHENSQNCASLVAARGLRRVTLVSERYHIRRARVLFARALAARGLAVELRVSAAPDHLGLFERITRCFRELDKLAADILRRPRG